jgi:hypothetical protein
MDIYRMLQRGAVPGFNFPCSCDKWLHKLYRTAQPSVLRDDRALPLSDLLKLEPKLFFPASAIDRLVSIEMLDDVSLCKCDYCSTQRSTERDGYSGNERRKMLKEIVEERQGNNWRKVLVAILLYIGEIPSLYKVYGKLLSADGIDSIANLDIPGDIKENFQSASMLFRPEHLSLDRSTRHFPPMTRLPFLNEEVCGAGSFGVVTKVEIHPDYASEKVKALIAQYAVGPGKRLEPGQKVESGLKSAPATTRREPPLTAGSCLLHGKRLKAPETKVLKTRSI